MGTFYTNVITIDLQADVPERKWREIFYECGGSMNMCIEAFDEFGDKYTLTEDSFDVMFITNRGGPFISYAQDLYSHFVELCPDAEVSYAYDSNDDNIHGFWKNGVHQQERFYELYEVINGTYTPLSIQKENEKYLIIMGSKKVKLDIISKEPISSFDMFFSQRHSGVEYQCTHDDIGLVKITEYDEKFYSEDLEYVYGMGLPTKV